jgi:hypothetical protein
MRSTVLFIFAICNCCLVVSSFSQSGDKKQILTSSVDFRILTFSSVSCENFEPGFQSRLTKRVIIAQDTVALLEAFLKRIKYEKKNRDVNVRAKIIYDAHISKIEICFSGYYIAINGRLTKKNQDFTRFLRYLVGQPS